MKLVRNLIIPALVILLASCNNWPYFDDYTTQRPKFTDLIGTYRFEEQNVTPNGNLTVYKKSLITLKADGRYFVSNVTDFANDTTNKYVKDGFISATGRWQMKVDTVETEWGGKKLHWGVVFNPEPGLPFVGFLGKSPPYKLILNYTDIDLGEVMIFSKK